jgi:para-nitrobenzyl esterase
MKTLLVTCLLLAAQPLVESALASPAPPSVTANGELLTGAWESGEPAVAAFRGIPFAAPPVGDRRWRAPAEHSPRTGAQQATKFAPACMQGTGGVDWYIGVAAAFGHGPEVVGRPNGVSEDCLYLNIWSPRQDPAARLPVMVFVHGGSNAGGWSYEPNYHGAELARRGAVVVTIAYRLGPFGFFAHESLDNGAGEPVANFGLLDIRAAFQWVRNHVAAFGGDPDTVTAFGESAGAFNLVDLLLADLGAGEAGHSPFRRLILQSIGGALFERQTLAEEQAVGQQLVGLLGIGEDTAAERLRAISAADLLAAAGQLPADHYPDGVIDGQIVPGHPLEILAEARMDGVDIILGTNADEWLMYVEKDAGREELEAWAREHAAESAAALLAAVAAESDPRRALDRLITARRMLCPSRALADYVNAAGGQSWVYRFSRQRPGTGGQTLGSYHGAELPYVFGTHDAWLPTEPADLALTAAVMDYWLAFARRGDPNVAGRSFWPVYTRGRPDVLELDVEVRVVGAADRELCEQPVPHAAPAGAAGQSSSAGSGAAPAVFGRRVARRPRYGVSP